MKRPCYIYIERSGKIHAEADTLNLMAKAFVELCQYKSALCYYKKALTIFRKIGAHGWNRADSFKLSFDLREVWAVR